MGRNDRSLKPIKVPLPPGKVLIFDHVKGEVRVEGSPDWRLE